MRKNTNKAFTLVELIVVITILAILATVAFISLGGQTEKARNTTKKDAVGKLATAVENAKTRGVGLASFVGTTGTVSKLTAGMVGGLDATTNSDAADINYSALDVKAEDFKDGTQSYKYGYTASNGGKYEIAGKLGGDIPETYLAGTYYARSGTVTASATGSNSVTLAAADIKKFTKGDYISDGTNTGRVLSVSDDYTVLTLDASLTTTTVGLSTALGTATHANESAGLIDSTTPGTPVTNASTTALPY